MGLGERPCDYEITVRWPDGTTAQLSPEDVLPNQYHTLVYPDQVVSGE